MAKSNARKHAEQQAAKAAEEARAAAAAAGKSEEEQRTAAIAAASGIPPINPDQDVEVRVLADCLHGRANDVVRLRLAELEQALETGAVDDHPDAVAYAKSLSR